jgi:hypothetical protein
LLGYKFELALVCVVISAFHEDWLAHNTFIQAKPTQLVVIAEESFAQSDHAR